MDNAPQNKKGMNTGAAIFGMVITFFLGIYVGFHPLWFPFDVGQSTNSKAGVQTGPGTIDDDHMPTSVPATSTSKPA